MPDILPRATVALLFLVHGVLVLWALMGLAEYLLQSVPWPRISNPLFPDWVLLAQWLLVLPVALLFVVGYWLAWPLMPTALAVGYALMAGLCAYQTLTILENDTRFLAMAAEYVAYGAILIFLFRSAHVRAHFGAA